MLKPFSKYIYPDNLFPKLKLYGLKNFIRFSVIEIYRICLRLFFSSFSQFHEDLISIDTEGFDLKVLRGNDRNLFRSKIICLESLDSKIGDFLLGVGYHLVYKNLVNAIYLDSQNE